MEKWRERRNVETGGETEHSHLNHRSIPAAKNKGASQNSKPDEYNTPVKIKMRTRCLKYTMNR